MLIYSYFRLRIFVVCLKLQAVYNLAYMVEYNYSLNGIHWNNVNKEDILQGNLTLAAALYEK